MTNRSNKIIKFSALILLPMFFGNAGAQVLLGNYDASASETFDLNEYYVGSDVCEKSCFGVYGSSTDPVWSIEARNAAGALAMTQMGIITLQQEGDESSVTQIDMERYDIDAAVVGYLVHGTGDITIVLDFYRVDTVTGEKVVIESDVVTISKPDFD